MFFFAIAALDLYILRSCRNKGNNAIVAIMLSQQNITNMKSRLMSGIRI
jgi:hypothetical protein